MPTQFLNPKLKKWMPTLGADKKKIDKDLNVNLTKCQPIEAEIKKKLPLDDYLSIPERPGTKSFFHEIPSM